jgi:hypothetical protein
MLVESKLLHESLWKAKIKVGFPLLLSQSEGRIWKSFRVHFLSGLEEY